jgi:hypothetical protein
VNRTLHLQVARYDGFLIFIPSGDGKGTQKMLPVCRRKLVKDILGSGGATCIL